MASSDAPQPALEALPPSSALPEQVGAPKPVAAGLPSVLSTAQRVLSETGVTNGVRALLKVNQKDGFDCQSCAWPDPDGERHFVEFCEQGAKAVTDELTKGRVDAAFFSKWSVAALSQQSDFWHNQQGRLTQPMHLAQGATHYTPISWADAFQRIAKHVHALDDPDEAIFYTSGRTSNEAAFLFQLFARAFGTNNLPDCSNMCHESSGLGLKETIGIGKGTVTLADFETTDLIVIIGQNPGSNHPRMMTSLERAKKNGARIISINPLLEAGLVRFKQPQDLKHPIGLAKSLLGQGTKITDLHLPVRIGGDVALLKGLAKALLALEVAETGAGLAASFIATHTKGYDAFATDVDAASWDAIVDQSGISQADIEEAASWLASTERIIFCWAMGLTQHPQAVANIQMVVNLALMRGAIGKPGAGLCPVRGHSNVQGDRTVGITPRPSAAFLDRLADTFGFSPPRDIGLDTVDSIRAMRDGKAKIFLALGGNFLSATPDTLVTAEALQRCDLTVQISTKLNRSHLITGKEALILPCLGRSERDEQGNKAQFVSVENSMGIVHQTTGTFAPAFPDLRSEPWIIAELAAAVLGPTTPIDWRAAVQDYDRIRLMIEAVVPGFEAYNERVRKPGGFYLPNAPRHGTFATPDGKAHFTVHALPNLDMPDDAWMMMTIRSHDQFNTTVYGMDDRYRGIRGDRHVVFMNPKDMQAHGWRKGQRVNLVSAYANEARRAEGFQLIPYPIPSRCIATYFPETNVLVPLDHVAHRSNTPASKSIIVTLEPVV